MLIICRKTGESFQIGENVKVHVLEVQNDKIKIGIDAPRDVRVMRQELLETENTNLKAALSAENTNYDAFKEAIRMKNLKNS